MKIKPLYITLVFTLVTLSHVIMFQKVFAQENSIKIKQEKIQPTKISLIKIKKKKVEKEKEPKIIKKESKPKPKKKIIKKIKKTPIKHKPIKKVSKLKEKTPLKKKLPKQEVIKRQEPKKIIKKPIRTKQIEHKKEIIEPEVNKQEQLKASLLQEYISYIQNTIESEKFYPRMAKRLNMEGSCTLEFIVLSDGSIKEVSLCKKSEFSVLNKSAIKILKKIGSFKSFPKDIDKDKINLKIPIQYALKG